MLHFCKYAIGNGCLAKEFAEQFYPLGTPQRRGFEIVGTLYDRYSERSHGTIAGILVRRYYYGFGRESHYLLHGGRDGRTGVDDAPVFKPTQYLRHLVILGIAHTLHGVHLAKFFDGTGVHRRIDQCALEWSPHQCARGQRRRQLGIARHEDIGLQHFALHPRIHHIYASVTIAVRYLQ